MKQVNLVKVSGSNPAEIFQSLDIKFALLNEKFEQVHLGIKCRDFLGDCIWSKNNHAKASIYGFSYDYTVKPYDAKKPKMSLKFPNTSSCENFLKNIDFLHQKEKLANVSETVVYSTQEKDTYVVEFDKAWMEGAWKISLYSFFIKLLSYDDPANPDVETNEYEYLSAMPTKKEAILLANIKTYKTKWEGNGISEVHNDSGFKSVCDMINPIGKEFFKKAA